MADDLEQLNTDHELTGDLADDGSGEAPTASMPDRTMSSTSQIGPYRLLQQIGEGGMGEVWLAEQSEPVKRRVAVKVIKRGMDTKNFIARFEAERQALAMMDHPTIAKVFDAGETADGRPYFVMEHIKGEPITTYCDNHRLTTAERLGLFTEVCAGVQHAHQKAIIHRDLKPSNVLVTIQDGRPVPKLIDFGVAKALAQPLTEKTMFTELGQMIGTPAYMSPEQAEMSGLNVDTRTDVYSLGVLLYQLLVGALPFDPKELRTAGYSEMMRVLREDEPPRPSTRLSSLGEASKTSAEKRRTDPAKLRSLLQEDLDWVVMKAIEKDRNRRYETANGLAMDLKRYLANEPVAAGPPSKSYRAKKFVQRHRVGVISAAIAAGLMVAFIAALGVLYLRATKAEDAAVEARDESEAVTTFLADMLAAADPTERGREVTVQEVLDEAALRIDGEFENQPLTEARLRQTIGATYTALGEFEKAESQLPKSVETRLQMLGADHPDTLIAKHELGVLLNEQGKNVEAESVLREVLGRRQMVLGRYHPETLESVAALATLLNNLGRADESETLLSDALEHRRRSGTEPDAITLELMSQLAASYWNQSRQEEEEALRVEILELSQKLFGPNHPQTVDAQHTLAVHYMGSFRYTEAEALLTDVLAKTEHLYGNDHPRTQTAKHHLAVLYLTMSRPDEAEPLFKEGFQDRQAAFGSDHPNTITALANVGKLYLYQMRWRDAEAVMVETLARAQRAMPDSWARGVWKRRLGLAQRELGKYREAEETLLESLDILIGARGIQDRYAQDTMRHLTDLYAEWGHDDRIARWADDIDLDKEVNGLKEIEARFGSEHPTTAGARYNVAQILDAKGRYEEAEPMYAEILADTDSYYGDTSPVSLRLRRWLARRDQRLGNLDRAETRWRQSLDLAERAKSAADRARALFGFATHRAATGRNAEAFTMLERAITTGFAEPDRLQQDPDLARLRPDARFRDLVAAAHRNDERQPLDLPPGVLE